MVNRQPGFTSKNEKKKSRQKYRYGLHLDEEK